MTARSLAVVATCTTLGAGLLGAGATGVASLDSDLQAAAELQAPETQPVVKREHIEPCHSHKVRLEKY